MYTFPPSAQFAQSPGEVSSIADYDPWEIIRNELSPVDRELLLILLKHIDSEIDEMCLTQDRVKIVGVKEWGENAEGEGPMRDRMSRRGRPGPAVTDIDLVEALIDRNSLALPPLDMITLPRMSDGWSTHSLCQQFCK
ncbi:hypothetical protein PRIPAC_95977 [Pristionchus pacificus]|uniref:Uncharacterized protein n=1 Tax=Pristionchus pacificus TaxID=54126 RepID=A0A2A6D1Q9_PRIPA|nr:hypothetical protein PRIPAC_95977 [Pristionchus pacificus]|eukprot:PDM84384.1 hypothetical protein PRIPAC_33407 [Pristionchus pacificus]